MLSLKHLHHIALICSDYDRSKEFYTHVLGFTVLNEHYRADRKSYKLDLALNGSYLLELFSFENPPQRVNRPEAAGLRHLAFAVENLEEELSQLDSYNVIYDSIRIDPLTGKRFVFFFDPDGLPLELYEA